MTALRATIGLALASMAASLFSAPELGLFLAVAALAVFIDASLANRDRRDARNRNHAHRR